MEKSNKVTLGIISLLLLVVFVSGCTSDNQSSNMSSNTTMGPKNYSDGLISFTYPGNWTVNTTGQTRKAGDRYMNVEDSTGKIDVRFLNPQDNSAYYYREFYQQADMEVGINITDSGQITLMNNTAYYYTINAKDGSITKYIYFDIKPGISMSLKLIAPDNNTFEKNKANFDMILNSLTVNKDYNITFKTGY